MSTSTILILMDIPSCIRIIIILLFFFLLHALYSNSSLIIQSILLAKYAARRKGPERIKRDFPTVLLNIYQNQKSEISSSMCELLLMH